MAAESSGCSANHVSQARSSSGVMFSLMSWRVRTAALVMSTLLLFWSTDRICDSVSPSPFSITMLFNR